MPKTTNTKIAKVQTSENTSQSSMLDYGPYILDLVMNGRSEQEAYHLVFSIVMEETFSNKKEFEALLTKKTTERPKVTHNAVAMTEKASEAPVTTNNTRPNYVFSADGT